MDATAGKGAWLLLAGLALLAVLEPFGCRKDREDETALDARIAELLADVWPEVVEPAVREAREATDVLVAATEAWARAGDEDAEAARDAARGAWRAAMESWQELEVLQIGPAASSLTAVGGADLRDEIYSWPTVNRCRVDQETVKEEWDGPDYFTANLVNAYGLDALEVVLFSPEGENACPPQAPPNADGTWEALGPDGVARNRARFGHALARGVAERVRELETAWRPGGGDFAGALAAAGEPGSVFASRRQALNAVFDALFYLETRTKDRKLGGPLGRWDCGAASCLQDVETRLAGGSDAWVAANLRGFRKLFGGGEGTGLDDLLHLVGEADLADGIVSALDAADAAAEALALPIDRAVDEAPEAAGALHDAVKEVTDRLKGDVATVLSLQIPSEAAGDND